MFVICMGDEFDMYLFVFLSVPVVTAGGMDYMPFALLIHLQRNLILGKPKMLQKLYT